MPEPENLSWPRSDGQTWARTGEIGKVIPGDYASQDRVPLSADLTDEIKQRGVEEYRENLPNGIVPLVSHILRSFLRWAWRID